MDKDTKEFGIQNLGIFLGIGIILSIFLLSFIPLIVFSITPILMTIFYEVGRRQRRRNGI